MLQTFIFNETSPAAAGTAISSQAVTNSTMGGAGVATPISDADAINIIAELVGATGGTLDVYVQTSPDGGVNWFDAVHFTQLAAAASAVKYDAPLSLFTTVTTPVAVGKNLVPALATGTIVNGAFSDRARLLFVAGAGTSAGAAVKVTLAVQRADPRNVA